MSVFPLNDNPGCILLLSDGEEEESTLEICRCKLFLAGEYAAELNGLLKLRPEIIGGHKYKFVTYEPVVGSGFPGRQATPEELEREREYFNEYSKVFEEEDAHRFRDHSTIGLQFPKALIDIWAKVIVDVLPSRYYNYSEDFPASGVTYSGKAQIHGAHNYYDTKDGGYTGSLDFVVPNGTWGGMQEYKTRASFERQTWAEMWCNTFGKGHASDEDFYAFRERVTTAMVATISQGFPNKEMHPILPPDKERRVEEPPMMR